MGKDPDAIRQEIERTREGMNDKVEALGYKMDVKSRARDKVRGFASKPKDAIMGTTHSVKDRLSGSGGSDGSGGIGGVASAGRERIGGAASTSVDKLGEVAGSSKRGLMYTKDRAKDNPMALAIGGIAVGMLAGLVAPRTRMEDQRLGEAADNLKGMVKETGSEALDHGRQIAQEAAGAAAETAKEQGREHGEELVGNAKDKAGVGGSDSSDPSSPMPMGAVPTRV